MNMAEALNLIKSKMDGDDSPVKNQTAASALEGAINFFSLIGEYKWNEQYVTATLTSGTSLYQMSDLAPGFTIRKIYDESIYLTDESGKIEFLTTEKFNEQKRGYTSTGKPRIATIHSRDAVLEVYPTPSKSYAIWFRAGILLRDIAELPAELHLPCVFLAVMSSVKADSPEGVQAEKMWTMSLPLIPRAGSWLTWDGNQVFPDSYVIGHTDRSITADSVNVVGEL